MPRGSSRLALTAFFAVLVPLVAVLSLLANVQPDQTAWIYALMAAPAASALIAWPISGVRPRFGRLGWRSLLFPIVLIGFVACGYLVPDLLGALEGSGVPPAWISVLFGIVPSIALALGEELGWRGYLLPQLRRSSSFWVANAVVAMVWMVYHLPIILWGVYAPTDRSLSVALTWFIVNVVLFSFTIGALWEITHDVWMPAIAHGLWNVLIADVFLKYYDGSPSWMLGEFGFLPAVPLALALVLALWMSRRSRPARLELTDQGVSSRR